MFGSDEDSGTQIHTQVQSIELLAIQQQGPRNIGFFGISIFYTRYYMEIVANVAIGDVVLRITPWLVEVSTEYVPHSIYLDQAFICFAFHDSRLLMETYQEAKNLRKIVTLFYLD
ncbi:hypothetical protein ACOSQ3_014040 [Xanthoceras sorbifolium]